MDDESLNLNLNTFFPFDPYKLQQSATWMDNIYREWSAVAIDLDSDEEDSDEEGGLVPGREDLGRSPPRGKHLDWVLRLKR